MKTIHVEHRGRRREVGRESGTRGGARDRKGGGRGRRWGRGAEKE